MQKQKTNLHPILSNAAIEHLKKGSPWILKKQLNPDYRLPAQPGLIYVAGSWFLSSPMSNFSLKKIGPQFKNWFTYKIEEGGLVINHQDFRQHFLPQISKHIQETYIYKKNLLRENCFRLIFAESDFIPGIVADIFESTIVVQIQNAAIEYFWPLFKEAFQSLREVVGSEVLVIEKRNHRSRLQEGLLLENESSNVEDKVIVWNGLKWNMRPGGEQKTGAYLDQKFNHLKAVDIGTRVNAKAAWDICSFEGGFGLHLASAGLSVIGVDKSEKALSKYKQNAALNNLEKIEFIKADAFDFLNSKISENSQADIVIIDPPSFAKTEEDKKGAWRGFRDLNSKAIQCVKPDGILISCSCTHQITPNDYREILKEASIEAKREIKILEFSQGSFDHATLAHFSEGDYLQAWFAIVY